MKKVHSTFSELSDWIKFKLFIQSRNRYVLDSSSKLFIDVLLSTAKVREQIIGSAEGPFYRARRGYREPRSSETFFPKKYPYTKKDMKKPPADNATEGRLNPKGISYLYLSSDDITSIAETRAWIGELVSVAECSIFPSLKVVNLIPDADKKVCSYFKDNPISKEKEDRIWHDVAQDFSVPIADHITNIKHTPIQYIAEALKVAGYEGIMYKSSLSQSGYNVVIFNDWKINIIRTKLHEVVAVGYKAKQFKDFNLKVK